MKVKRHILVFIEFFIFYLHSGSQNYSKERAIIYNSSNGLCNEFISEIHKDAHGLLWFGTQNGLQRFDGHNFLTFQHNAFDSASLPNNWVTEIEEDSKGNLWIGMLRGIAILDIKSLQFKTVNIRTNDKPIEFVRDMVMDPSDHLWLVTQNGIYSNINADTIFELLYPHVVYRPIIYNEGILIKSNTGYDFWKRTKNQKQSKLEKLNLLEIQREYLVDYKSIKQSNPALGAGNFLHYELEIQWYQKNINYIIYYTRKEVWSYFPLSGEHKLLFKLEDIYDNNQLNLINTVWVDTNNDIWIGTEEGVAFVPCNTGYFNVIKSQAARDIKFRDSTIWICGAQGLKELDYEGRVVQDWINFHVNSFDVNDTNIVACLQNRTILIINRKSKKVRSIKLFYKESLISNIFFTKFYKDKIILGGNPILGLYDLSLNLLDYAPTSTISTNDQVLTDIMSGLESKNETFWIGTMQEGVYHFKIENDTFSLLHHIPTKAVFYIQEDEQGRMIFATTNGIDIYNNEVKIKTITKQDGLPEDKIMATISDKDSNIWISTIGQGLVKWEEKNNRWHYYNITNGLPSNNFLFGSAAKDAQGNLFFGAQNSLITFKPIHFKYPSEKIEPLLLTSITINDRPFHFITGDSVTNSIYVSKLKLQHDQNRLEFIFSLPTHAANNDHEYQYRLSSIDKAWKKWKSGEVILYDRLPFGNYSLQWQAQNQLYNALSIHIKPPWYKSILAIIIFIILSVCGILWVVKKIIQFRLGQQKLIHEKELVEVRSNYFSNLSHEIKTPLQLIQGPLQLLRQKIHHSVDKEAHMELIHLAEKQTARIHNLVKEMDTLQKIDSKKLSVYRIPLNLNTFLNDLIQTLKTSDHSGTISIHFNSDLPDNIFYLLDDSHITSMVYNLVQNVFDHAKGAENIWIDLRVIEKEIKLTISDDGIGIPPSVESKIFDRFFTYDLHKIGSGLGLALVKELTEANGGTITYTPRSPKGSTFKITLHADSISLLTDMEPASELSKVNNTEVVIVDDDTYMIDFLKKILSPQYAITSFSSPRLAFEFIISELPDIIITDRKMPEWDGISFSSMLKTNLLTHHIPIIIMSGKDDIEDKIAAYKSNVDIFISKPFSYQELHSVIEQLLHNRKLQHQYALSQIKSSPALIPTDPFVNNLLTIIESEMASRTINIDMVCMAMAVSRTQLFRKCQAHFGVSFIEILNEKRLIRAKKLLTESSKSIKEIASECGFTDANYFGKFFKKETQLNPVEYRNQNQG